MSAWLVRYQLSTAFSLAPEDLASIVSEVCIFVSRSRRNAPIHIRLGLLILEVAFTTLLVLGGVPKPESKRARSIIKLWSVLPGPTQNLLRFYASLTMLCTCELRVMRNRFGFPDPSQRLATMRLERIQRTGASR